MTKIYYNGVNPFAGLSTTPFVGRSVDMIQYGERWGQSETLKLRGLITGECTAFEVMVQKKDALISGFRKDFKTFNVFDSVAGELGDDLLGVSSSSDGLLLQDGGLFLLQDGSSFVLQGGSGTSFSGVSVFSRDYVKVVDIAFDQSNYAYGIPYTVTLQAYPADYFSGQYGILEPKDEFVYSEADNGTLNITHTISAKGFVTDSDNSNSLENARQWVQDRRGLSGHVEPLFISGLGLPCLVTTQEIVNRLAATYEIRDSYTSDQYAQQYGLLRYTTDYNYDYQDGRSIIEVKGEVVGCKEGTMEQVRDRYHAFNAYQEAVNHLRRVTGRIDLNMTPISKGLSEDPKKKHLGFTFTFNDDLSGQTWFEYTVSFDYDFENDLISASIEGKVNSRVDIATRWAAVQAYAKSINLYALLLPFYNAYAQSIGVTYPLNSLARSTSYSENRFNYEISLGAKYDNNIIPPFGLSLLDYTIGITPPLAQYSDVPCLDGEGRYTTFDLGFKSRKIISLQGRALGSPHTTGDTVQNAIRAQALALQNLYMTNDRPHLDAQSLSFSNSAFGLNGAFEATYSCDDSVFTI